MTAERRLMEQAETRGVQVRQGLREDIEEAVAVDEQLVEHKEQVIQVDEQLMTHKEAVAGDPRLVEHKEAVAVDGQLVQHKERDVDLVAVRQHMKDIELSLEQVMIIAEKYKPVKESDLIHLKLS
jgi:hypothetical protein